MAKALFSKLNSAFNSAKYRLVNINCLVFPAVAISAVVIIAYYMPLYAGIITEKYFLDLKEFFLEDKATIIGILSEQGIAVDDEFFVSIFYFKLFLILSIGLAACCGWLIIFKSGENKFGVYLRILLVLFALIAAHIVYIFNIFVFRYDVFSKWSLVSICTFVALYLFLAGNYTVSRWFASRAERKSLNSTRDQEKYGSVSAFIRQNRERADRLTIVGNLILIFIVLFIAAIGVILISINRWIDTESSVEKKLNFVQAERRELDFKLRNAASEEQEANFRMLSVDRDYAKSNDELMRKETELKSNNASLSEFQQAELGALREATSDLKSQVDEAKYQADRAKQSRAQIELEKQGSYNFVNRLTDRNVQLTEGNELAFLTVSTSAIRIGILVVSIFLMRFFVQIYQYNARLASYSQSRADLAMLSSLDGVDPERLADLIWKDLTFTQATDQIDRETIDKLLDMILKATSKP